ncbi:MAG TPA: substrate-binding domain-containing protein [Luteolibacter sp.]|nr:substrate-binding domain-containing protein [Luteolibacter sp.]
MGQPSAGHAPTGDSTRSQGCERPGKDFPLDNLPLNGAFKIMAGKNFSSLAEQVAQEIRAGLQEARWRGRMPGRKTLARELGVNHKTCEAALRMLEADGALVSEGPGLGRRIVGTVQVQPKRLRVMILLYEKSDRGTGYLVDLLHRLQKAGHQAEFAARTMQDMGMEVKRIARMVQQTDVDAWIVVAGSFDVLQWFSEQPTPAFALFGRLTQVPLASTSPRKADALKELVDRLVDFGHRRIVMLAREDRRKPVPGFIERLFLSQLEQRGVPTGAYNLPDWGDHREGLQQILTSLFRHTPPTALIASEPSILVAVLQHLSGLGIQAPNGISLACMDADEMFEWCTPNITHIAWDSHPVVQRVIQWAENISRGKDDRRKTANNARLILGGTIGPAPK